ncbi:MAG: ABC transporter permease subunit [Candidatus Eremiobacteraeota bacterium]|nr:ABC transporter permease subunit [Candidatus Eremiobacteraeota bacterium]MCW5867268.1 ABC transporter permease subunit [Candidatus Eremiobacteraeota bacterium]
MLAIFRRDLSAYFNSITVWILTAAYLFVSGLIFTLMVSNFVESSMGGPMSGRTPNIMDELVLGYQWWLGFLMIFLLPMLTMRLLAEEKRIGTLELLFTYPVNEWEIVLAKFFASLLTVLGMLGMSCISLAYISSKTPLDWTLVASGYAGLALMASTLIAIGLWASSLSASQVIAACITYGLAMMLWLMQLLDKFLPEKLTQGFGEDSKGIGSLGIMTHLESFARGNISSHDIVYYLALTLLFLFLTVRVLDSRKWRM